MKQWKRSSDFLSWWLQNDLLDENSQNEMDKYYASFKKNFSEHIRYWYDYQLALAEKHFQNRLGIEVLDIGCGCGTESLWMAMQGVKVNAIDVSPRKISTAKARLKVLIAEGYTLDVDFSCMNLLDVPDGKKYDLIWMEQAFHHLEPRGEVIRKLVNILSPGGVLAFSESNAWNPWIQIFLLKFRGIRTVVTSNDFIWGNERILTPGGLNRLMKEAGLQKISCEYFRVLPNKGWGRTALRWEKRVPKWLFPFFTHYSMDFKKPL